MPLEQRHVSKQLVLPRKRGSARALPRGLSPTLLHVTPQVREHREALLPTALARQRFGTVAPLEVVPQTEHRLQRPELLVRLVAVASFEGAREPRRFPTRPARERVRSLELVPVGSHVHPKVGVAREALPAHLAEVEVLRQEFHRVQLHHVGFVVGSLREGKHVLRRGD